MVSADSIIGNILDDWIGENKFSTNNIFAIRNWVKNTDTMRNRAIKNPRYEKLKAKNDPIENKQVISVDITKKEWGLYLAIIFLNTKWPKRLAKACVINKSGIDFRPK